MLICVPVFYFILVFYGVLVFYGIPFSRYCLILIPVQTKYLYIDLIPVYHQALCVTKGVATCTILL